MIPARQHGDMLNESRITVNSQYGGQDRGLRVGPND